MIDVVCGDVFDVELPLGEARLVYADPPYTLDDVHGYGTWPDPELLIGRMLELGARDAAFVLHTGWPNLEELLPTLTRLIPKRQKHYKGQPDYRVMAWVKPWKPSFTYANVAFQLMWEPVLVWYGRDYKNPKWKAEADWICALRNKRARGGHSTQKPDELHSWLFDRILDGDVAGRLALDLFAGTGSAGLTAARRGMRAVAIERDPDFCARIVEAAGREPEASTWRPTVEVTAHGLPDWPTLGRELWQELLPDHQPQLKEA